MMKRSRWLLLLVSLTIIAAACGGVPSGGTAPTSTSTSTSTSTTPPFTAALQITIGTDARPAEFTAELTCGDSATASGYLADTAGTACDLLASSEDARRLLVDGPPADRVCTQIYGGGEVANITGSIGGAAVSATVNRSNGCGIADWELLQPLLVDPYDLQSPELDCSAAHLAVREEAPQGDLPVPVAALRNDLFRLASECDIDGLGIIAVRDATRISFGGPVDPATFWRDLESTEATPIADLITVLRLAPGILDLGDGTIYYVWPAVFALFDWSQASPEQRQELADLFGTDALAGWDSFGGYIGYRVGITTDGEWAYFVEGD